MHRILSASGIIIINVLQLQIIDQLNKVYHRTREISKILVYRVSNRRMEEVCMKRRLLAAAWYGNDIAASAILQQRSISNKSFEHWRMNLQGRVYSPHEFALHAVPSPVLRPRDLQTWSAWVKAESRGLVHGWCEQQAGN